MAQINELTQIGELDNGDLFPVFDSRNERTRSVSAGEARDFFAAELTAGFADDVKAAQDAATDAENSAKNAESIVASVSPQVREAMRRTYAEAGFNMVPGSFERGGIVTSTTDVLLYEANGRAYGWDGALSVGGKVVPQNSTPSTAGGVGPNLWLDKSSATLNRNLSEETGAGQIGRIGGGTVADVMPLQSDIVLTVPVDFPSISAALLSLQEKRFPRTKVAINVLAGVYVEPATLPIAHIDGKNISILGDTADLTITSITSVVAGVFSVKHWDGVTKNLNYHTVTGVVSGSIPSAGEFLLVRAAAGDSCAEYHLGVWEVTAVVGTQVTWATTLHTAPPVGNTILSGKILKSVVQFLDGAKGPAAIQVDNSLSVGLIDKLAIVGAAAPIVIGTRGPTNYDVYGGFGGSTGVVARDGGILNLGSDIGVSGFSGSNVYSNRSGTIVVGAGAASSNSARNGWGSASATTQADSCIASGNLIDGFIAQDAGFTFSPRSKSNGNHRHAYVAAGGGSLNATNSTSKGCLGNGIENINSNVLANNSTINDNTGLAINNVAGDIRAPSCDLRGNAGVSCSSAGSLNITSCNVDGVQVSAMSGGLIDITGVTGTPTLNVPANHYSIFGGFITSGSTQSFIGFSSNGANSAMRISDTNHLLVGTAADLAGQSAARLHCNGPAVFAGAILPSSDNSHNFGSASLRGSTAYFANGVQTTSDADHKTDVRPFTQAEIAAAKDLSREIGFFKWLSKMDRDHCGLTVQRAMEIMESHGLKPFDYSFICYDEWDDLYEPVFVEKSNGEREPTGDVRLVRKAGHLYQFRDNELDRFMLRGLCARLDESGL